MSLAWLGELGFYGHLKTLLFKPFTKYFFADNALCPHHGSGLGNALTDVLGLLLLFN